ncbi:MAG TPA: RDD family protein [Jiangellaceae bacterium]|nr:RDD family protein [Jiangellaceae bacterium]
MTEPARLQVTGHYAGAVSRAVAAVLDFAIAVGAFTAALAGIDLLSRVILGESIGRSGIGYIIAFVAWAFLYIWGSLAVAGRTLGKGIVGLRVVSADGSALTVRRALARTVAYPFSFAILGLGLVGIVIDRYHRALHDVIAKTAVVYDWGGRAAEIPGPLSEFLARRAGTEYTTTPSID